MSRIRTAIILFAAGWVLSFLFNNMILTALGCLVLGIVLDRKPKTKMVAAKAATSTRVQHPSEKNLCPICRRQLTWIQQYNQWYCYSCKQYRQPAPARPASPPSPRPPSPSATTEMKYCISCGASIPERAKHCPKCGAAQQ